MKILLSIAMSAMLLLGNGSSMAQNGNMMNGGMGGYGWMGGYGGIWLPILLVIVFVGFVAWIVSQKGK